MKKVWLSCLAAVTAILAAGPATAGPLDVGLVPQDAAWVVHADFDALRESTLGRAMREEAEARGGRAHLSRMSEVIGFDVAENLRSATLFGEGYSRDSTAILITVAGDTGNIEGLMLAAPGYRSERKDDGRVVHSFIARDPRRGDARMYVSIEPVGRGADTMVLAAYDPAVLEAAVARLDAPEAPAGREDGRALSPGAGSILFARVFDLDAEAADHGGQHSAVLSMIRDLALNLRENDGRLALSATAHVVDAQRAEQLRQLIEGGLAMAQLAGDRPPHAAEADHPHRRHPHAALVAEVARQVRVSVDGDAVHLALDVETQRVIEEARKLRPAE